MFCRYCGKEIGNESEQKFCPYCGRGVDGQSQANSFSAPALSFSGMPKLGGMKILICLLMVFGFLGIILPTFTLQVETLGLFNSKSSSVTCSLIDVKDIFKELEESISAWNFGGVYKSTEEAFGFFQKLSTFIIIIFLLALGLAAYSAYALIFVKDEELFFGRAKASTIISIIASGFVLLEVFLLNASEEIDVGGVGVSGAKPGVMLYVVLIACVVNLWLISREKDPVHALQDKTCPYCGEVYTLGDECPRCGRRYSPKTSSTSTPSMAYGGERKAEGKRCPKCDTMFVIGNNCPNCGAAGEAIYASADSGQNVGQAAPASPKVKTCCTCSERFTEGEVCPICGSKIYSLK